MVIAGWQVFAVAVALGALGGVLFWLFARLALFVAAAWPATPPFAAELLAAAGAREGRRHRALGRELGAVFGALLAVPVVGGLAAGLLAALPANIESAPANWLLITLMAVAIVPIAAGVGLALRLVRARRRLRFVHAAKATVGDILKRLNFAGNRVFHEVAVEGAVIDHVVVGLKGVFAVNVVARPMPRRAAGENARAELRNGKLSLGGSVEALPVGDAARNMTLLIAALAKVAGHRVGVRSVLAVPGWNTAPNNGGNHLLLNENNLTMLTSWNTPDAYLMEEDCLAVQKFLQEASRARDF